MERAQGTRIRWEGVPLQVREAIEEWLGDRVVDVHHQQGGFSPGLAARLRTAGGTRVFLKAGGPELNPHTPAIYRHESRVAAALPAGAPVSRLLWTYDEGESGWVAVAFTDIDGRLPSHPWQPEELERVVQAIVALHTSLTPCPLDLPSVGYRIEAGLHGWSRLKDDEDRLDAWSRRHLADLIELERAAPEAAAGETMVHLDLRADNILLTDDGVVIVDWPNASVGAPWVDMLGMAPSVSLEGGPLPEEFFSLHPAARSADPDRVTAVLAAIAGYFTLSALQPPPPGLPTVRAFQAAQGEVIRRWLGQRLRLP